MGRLLTTRRSQWIPGVALVAAAAGVGALLGGALGPRTWAFLLGAVLGVLLVQAVLQLRARLRRRKPRQGRARSRSHAHEHEYDLASDRSTDDQRWLM